MASSIFIFFYDFVTTSCQLSSVMNTSFIDIGIKIAIFEQVEVFFRNVLVKIWRAIFAKSVSVGYTQFSLAGKGLS